MDDKLKCHICEDMDNRGIVLLDKYICKKCELDLSGSSVDGFKYEKLKEEIKNIWKELSAKYEDNKVLG